MKRLKRSTVNLKAAPFLLALLLLGFLGSAHTASAEVPTHVFDAVHSLSGDCSIFLELDEVPDPGVCPMPPGVEGVDHPLFPFAPPPSGLRTDEYGNLYVVNSGNDAQKPSSIAIFNPSGEFISEVSNSLNPQKAAQAITVDSEGHLYVYQNLTDSDGGSKVVRLDPTPPYNPAAGQIEYSGSPTTIIDQEDVPTLGGRRMLAVDAQDRLYVSAGVDFQGPIRVYGSAAEGNVFKETIGAAVLHFNRSIAIDRNTGDIYASDVPQGQGQQSIIRVFSGAAPHQLLRTIDGSTTPEGSFGTVEGIAAVAVDESTGHVFVADSQGINQRPVYEFTAAGEFVGKVEHRFDYIYPYIAIDNGHHSPNSGFAAENDSGYLFVSSGPIARGHVFAFAPVSVCPPQAQALEPKGVTASEALLRADVNPCGAATHWTLEYTSQAGFEAEGFAGAAVAGEGELAGGKEAVTVSAPVSGLQPGAAYRFRVSAMNELGEGDDERTFATYSNPILGGPPCPNEALRAGAANLMDCRAYELVTPGATNGLNPITIRELHSPGLFGSSMVSTDGRAVSFITVGGVLPGTSGSGSPYADGYLARRDGAGWHTEMAGPSGEQAVAPAAGGLSPDLGYSVWGVFLGGTLAVPDASVYIRHPNGSFERVGVGSIGVDPFATPRLIAPGAAHIIFGAGFQPSANPIQLEPGAPPSGTHAVYDRTSDGVTHVVSLLPGDLTPAAGENAAFQGGSPDGEGVVFTIGDTLYERLRNVETFELASGATFAGISAGGRRVFYLEGGDLFRFEEGATAQLTATGNVTPVNVSADGSHAFFASPSVLTPGEVNSQGDEAQPGDENLYAWAEGTTSYVATVTERDVVGEKDENAQPSDGLGLWAHALQNGGSLAIDPSRTTADGAVLIFASRADLTGFETEGRSQIYRYDGFSGELACVSCLPQGQAPSGDADLESLAVAGFQSIIPTSRYTLIPNLSSDGRRVFFQSPDPLVPADGNGLQDVYEWEAQGKGNCTNPGGCVALISSGQGSRPSYLYGVSESGDDVFFSSAQRLLPSDAEETPSIYDARVGGGFPEPETEPCQGEGCKTQPTQPPLAPERSTEPSGNLLRPCRRGTHLATHNGRRRCVAGKKHRHKKERRHAGKHGKAAR